MSHSIRTKNSIQTEHPAVAFASRGLKYIARMSTTYFSPKDLDVLCVKCTEIDVNSGSPKDEGLKVLELKSADKIKDIAEANERLNTGAISGKYIATNWQSADQLALFYVDIFNIEDLSGKTVLERFSPWEPEQSGKTDELIRSKVLWRVRFTLHLRDRTYPDIVCFLANDAPLEDNKLAFLDPATPYLYCVLLMQLEVTVVSASGTQARIVQGYIDSKENCLFVRKSSIFEVGGNKKRSLEGLMTIACWLFGNPCRV
ncbi:hypothetical protein F4818DRAFT_443899 [Hypoxylon cercidicola]|nr:hypothetical protein F4818DRAFT_443899 [Hypoxylon cercidicola]